MQLVDRAHAFLRANTRGELRFDEHLRPVKYIIGADGRLALPVMVAMLETVDTVLFIPAAQDGAMEAQLTLEKFEERGEDGASADRWRIYHGQPDDVRWAYATIDAVRFQGHVIDGQALTRSNSLAADEASLCRRINSNKQDVLRVLCHAIANVEVAEPVLVGIDPLGFDIRGRFDVHRIAAKESMNSADDVLDEFDALASEAGTS
jgi:hypothetical protein